MGPAPLQFTQPLRTNAEPRRGHNRRFSASHSGNAHGMHRPAALTPFILSGMLIVGMDYKVFFEFVCPKCGKLNLGHRIVAAAKEGHACERLREHPPACKFCNHEPTKAIVSCRMEPADLMAS